MTTFVFTGAVIESFVALDEFIKQGLKPELILTLKPEYAHRHSDWYDLQPIAQAHNIPVLAFNNINEDHVVEAVRTIAPDYLFVVGWSQLIHDELLAIPEFGCVGFHPIKLPEGRGRAAIPWTILLDKRRTGATMMYLDDGIDSGDIIAQVEFGVAPDETAKTLYDKVCQGIRHMIQEIAPVMLRDEVLQSTPQDQSKASYLGKRIAVDGWVDWSQSAEDIERLVRAVGHPYPGAFTLYNKKKVVIWKARMRHTFNHTGVIGQIMVIGTDETDAVTVQCGEGWLDIFEVQEEGNEPMPANQYFKRVHARLGINAYDLWQMFNQLSESIES